MVGCVLAATFSLALVFIVYINIDTSIYFIPPSAERLDGGIDGTA